jgi:hypothetical protein
MLYDQYYNEEITMKRIRKDFGAQGSHGYAGHCGPRSIIGALANNLQSGHVNPTLNSSLKPLITQFEQMFPQLTNTRSIYHQQKNTAIEKFIYLQKSMPEEAFLIKMGSALRQAASNEMALHQTEYPATQVTEGAQRQDLDTKPHRMRHDSTYIDEQFLKAASKIVGSIHVKSGNRSYEYNTREQHHPSNNNTVISLNHEGNHYTANIYSRPRVNPTSLFHYDSSIEQTTAIDISDSHREKHAQKILTQLSTQRLIELYHTLVTHVAKTNGDSYLTGRIKEISKERGLSIEAIRTIALNVDNNSEFNTIAREELIHVLSVESRRSHDSFNFTQEYILKHTETDLTGCAKTLGSALELKPSTPLRVS